MKTKKPLIRDIMKREILFPKEEANLPLILLARPHGYVVIARIIRLFIKYLRLLLIYKYNSVVGRERKKGIKTKKN